ncbi:protein-lysine N-methyltransferase EEF2KMT [Diachasma alloeum]|uniref:protein-lysine N-methyltransferase EEF2KMT n=1 Tax=Diachasma alloeum TaxID=454923 RepID=UPI000738410B|nr:protein-lysine N-methyltransferase EEF2KMT [Diachasma alloeum]
MSESTGINSIQRKFLSCFPISAFNIPQKVDLKGQIEIFNATVGDSRVLEYPIKREYQRKFVRKIIESLENDENNEIYELFYEALCEFLSKGTGDDEKTHYRHFLMGSEGNIDRLIIQESRSLISEGTTGLCSWQAALALGEWCVLHKDFLKTKKILELGSGVGLTGLTVLSRCSPEKFIFSDCHPSVLTLLRANVHRHSPKINPPHEIIDLPWENIDENLGNRLDVDLVIAADVIYDKSLFPSLINGLKILISSGHCFGVIAMTVRNEETISEFFQQLNSGGFSYEETDTPEFSIFIRSDDTPVKIIKLFYSNKKN